MKSKRYLKEKKEWYTKYRVETKKQVVSILGIKCSICEKSTKKILFHEIHFKKHQINYPFILKHLEDFIPICYKCHLVLHGLKLLSPKQRDNLVIALEKSKSKRNKWAKMQTTKYITVFDKILAEKNLYQVNGLVFSNTKPLICLGNLYNVLPKLLEKNKTEKENRD